jgi:acylpyruvate hydrolase
MKVARIYREGKEEYGIIKNHDWYPSDNLGRNDLGIENFIMDPVILNNTIEMEPACSINDDITWMSPIARPGKIICIGRNYLKHAEESGNTAELVPLMFSKYSSSLTGHLNSVPYPNHTENFDYEVELAVIIGKKASKLTEDDDPLDYIFGYTIANDLTARDVQKSEKQWTRGKAFDDSLPMGPYILTKDEIADPSNQEIWLTVNGEKRQLSSTSKMIFSIPYLIRYISQTITLEPGDILLTGTPEGVGYYMDPKSTLQKGDIVACGVTNIAELRFTIV